jgi:rfaE bifunctional protein kinase chain/domain
MNSVAIEHLFSRMNDLHVVVVGDVMLDNYWIGETERISPEAPVPIVQIGKKESRLGGAANVAINCKALGAKVTMASVTGSDEEGKLLKSLLDSFEIDTQLLQLSDSRITTTKTRIISRNQQMIRLDQEQIHELETSIEHPFIDKVLRMLQREKPQVLIFEDYNKGVLKENIIARIIAHCKELGIISMVDPKKNNFFSYKGVTVFKPNLKEVREGLNLELKQIDIDSLDDIHEQLKCKLDHECSFITLSEKGVYVGNDFETNIFPGYVRNIADVSGAGDTVIATAALTYAVTKDFNLMAQVANIAGGLVCEKVGVMPIDKELLKKEVSLLLQ